MGIHAIELAFSACTLLQVSGLPPKTHCREITIPLTESSPYVCMFGGQSEIARWQVEHPNWIRKPGYECRPMGQVAKA